MPKIIHFEINADDPLRAKGFYEKAFNWNIEKWDGPIEYWNIVAGEEDEEGINGGIQRRESQNDQIFNYIKVSSADEFKKKIEENGGTIVTPKITVPGVGYFYMFKDTEGNKLGIIQEDESAK
ncbi:MAG: VOC family protein [Promethearchaeia archaeon]